MYDTVSGTTDKITIFKSPQYISIGSLDNYNINGGDTAIINVSSTINFLPNENNGYSYFFMIPNCGRLVITDNFGNSLIFIKYLDNVYYIESNNTATLVDTFSNISYKLGSVSLELKGIGNLALDTKVVPDAPTSVSAIPGNSQAIVSYISPLNDGGDNIIKYTATAYNNQNIEVASRQVDATFPLTNIVVTGLTNGTEYIFKVKAKNSEGYGVESDSSSAITPATIPDAPPIVSSIALNKEAKVSFTAPIYNGGSAIMCYIVKAYNSNNLINPVFTTSGTSSPITVTGLTNGITYKFKVLATNAVGNGLESGLSNGVTPYSISINTSSLSYGYCNSFYNQTLNGINGNSPYTWTILSGSLPNGLSLNSSTGIISGTPINSNNNNSFTIKLMDANGIIDIKELSIIIYNELAIGTLSSLENGFVNSYYIKDLDETGGLNPYNWTITSGVLPYGLSIVSLTGVIDGIPTTAGTYNFTASLSDENKVSVSKQFTLKINATVPDAPTSIIGIVGYQRVTLSFIEPENNGGSIITSYTVKVYDNDGNLIKPEIMAAGINSPIIVSGLTNGITYKFGIYATNSIGDGEESILTEGYTPIAPQNKICYIGESKILAKDIATGAEAQVCVKDITPKKYFVFSSTQNKFVPVRINCISGEVEKFILIKKDSLGENKPSEDFYVTEKHPILINNSEIKAKNIIGSKKVNLEKQLIYTLVTDNREALLINNIDVICWEHNEFMQRYKKSKNAVWIENENMSIINK